MNKVEQLSNGNVLVDGKEYEAVWRVLKIDKLRPIVNPPIVFNISSEKTIKLGKDDIKGINEGETIHDFCKRKRCWAARDAGGTWHMIPKILEDQDHNRRPRHNEFEWIGKSYCLGVASDNPGVPWDKSLIAPDGSMPLMNPKKKDYSWLKEGVGILLNNGERAIFNEKFIPSEDRLFSVTEADKYGTHTGKMIVLYLTDIIGPISFRIRKPKRGDPIFVWDDGDDERCPAILKYYSRKDGKRVRTYLAARYGKESLSYDHYRLYDPALVGIPRNQWPKDDKNV
jgi:hypothetical protein